MTAADRPRRRSATIAYVVGGFGLAVGAATTLARSLPMSWGPLQSDEWAMATAFTDLGLLAYAISLIGLGIGLLLRRGRRAVIAAVSAVLLTALHAAWILPWFVPDRVGPGPETFTVLSLNLRFGEADPATVVDAARDADVLVLTEMTDPARTALLAAGIGERFPHEGRGQLPAGGATGTMVFSRFPISSFNAFAPEVAHQNWLADIRPPYWSAPVTVAAVHPVRPFRGESGWLRDQNQLRAAILAAEPDVVAGDFNAVDNQRPLRRLADDGYRCIDDSAGAGWLPTWPAVSPVVPPLAGIDHILLSPAYAAASAHTVRVPGTDHLGLMATVGRIATADAPPR